MSPRDGDTDVHDASWTDSSAWRARRRGATTFEHRPLVASPTARLGRHAPALGAHTRRVLAELGNGQAEAGRRLSARAVRAAE